MRVGIDLASVARFKKLAQNQEHLNKIFTDNEVRYILEKRSSVMGENNNNNANSTLQSDCKKTKFSPREYTIAGLFCAKEAVLKAFKIGILNKISLKDVEILHDNCGSLVVKLHNLAQTYFKENNFKEIEVNISHDREYATAICVVI